MKDYWLNSKKALQNLTYRQILEIYIDFINGEKQIPLEITKFKFTKKKSVNNPQKIILGIYAEHMNFKFKKDSFNTIDKIIMPSPRNTENDDDLFSNYIKFHINPNAMVGSHKSKVLSKVKYITCPLVIRENNKIIKKSKIKLWGCLLGLAKSPEAIEGPIFEFDSYEVLSKSDLMFLFDVLSKKNKFYVNFKLKHKSDSIFMIDYDLVSKVEILT